ncbi:hypothetical protein V2J09_022921 [Rumex salicifolius]
MVVQKRVDCVFVNSRGRISGRRIMLNTFPSFLKGNNQGNLRRRPFRFQAAWLSHPSFNDFLQENWDGQIELPTTLIEMRIKLRKWNKYVFGLVEKWKEELSKRMDKVQQHLARGPCDYLLDLNEKVQAELNQIMEQEEMKSRQKWIMCGDRNTAFFHLSTIIRRQNNRITTLKIGADSWCLNPSLFEEHILNYFRNLYAPDDLGDLVPMPREGVIVRDCAETHKLWEKLVPSCSWIKFFSVDLDEWLKMNLESHSRKEESDRWRITFATTIWWVWNWRNHKVFQNVNLDFDKFDFITERTKEYEESFGYHMGPQRKSERVVEFVGWSTPANGWIKLNCDGAVKCREGKATAAGKYK